MSRARDHANSMPRKWKGASDGGQFVSKGGPRAQAAPAPTVDLRSTDRSEANSTPLVPVSEKTSDGYYVGENLKRERMMVHLDLGIGDVRYPNRRNQIRHSDAINSNRAETFKEQFGKIDSIVETAFDESLSYDALRDELETWASDTNAAFAAVRNFSSPNKTLPTQMSVELAFEHLAYNRTAVVAKLIEDLNSALTSPTSSIKGDFRDFNPWDETAGWTSRRGTILGFTLKNIDPSDDSIEEHAMVQIGIPSTAEILVRWINDDMERFCAEQGIEVSEHLQKRIAQEGVNLLEDNSFAESYTP